jgi:hypothetical protein
VLTLRALPGGGATELHCALALERSAALRMAEAAVGEAAGQTGGRSFIPTAATYVPGRA